MKYTTTFAFITFILAGLSCDIRTEIKDSKEETGSPKAKNIILLIGDGMGLSQVSSRFFNGDGNPNFGRFNQIGLIRTSSSNSKITDSAAAGTALSSGVKTYNGAIGVNPDTTLVPSILEYAHENLLSTGIVATSSITHATPAAFYAHVRSRGTQEEIAEFLLEGKVDFFAAGGIQFFNKRADSMNLLSALTEKGYVMDTTRLADQHEAGQKYGYLFAADAMPPMIQGRGNFLPDATLAAINHLSKNEEGFFLMVEGSQIDWGGHANNEEYLVGEVLDFDKAIGIALDFAEKDGNTLVVVTADHETGGYTLGSTSKETSPGNTTNDYNQITGAFSTTGHSAALIPVFSYGPGSESFQGIYENNLIFHKMMEARGWKEVKK
ncbi:MAG: alkaline phosphatase [Cyclobacteriaceae bacterium]|nr:alkaline phosphatase [Cyclobacteriaceae bacterium]